LTFTLSDKQVLSLKESESRQNIWCGAVRSGKTFSSILKFIALCKSLPPGDALIAGVSRDTIQRNVIYQLCELTSIPIPTSKAPMMHLFGRRVHLVGAPDESAVRRIKGSTLALAYIDEITDVPEPFYKMILSRLSVTGAKLLGTTNPEGPKHWFKKNFLDNEELNLRLFSFGLNDNPSLSDDYKMELKKEYTGVWHDRYILGHWTRAEGLVFDGFDPENNVVEFLDRPQGYKIVGIDYGTTNPTACYLIDIKPNRWPQIYVEDEMYFDPAVKGYTMTDGEQADMIQEFLANKTIECMYVDPAAASLKLELTRKDFAVINAENDVLHGIKITNKFLKQLNVVINEKCVNLIEQLQSYVWDQKMVDKGRDEPLKKDDHACFVAGTKVITERGSENIEDVKKGDKVLTRHGYKEVLETFELEKDVIGVDVLGKKIRCTPDHKFLTLNGWKKSEDLIQSDILFTELGEASWLKKSDLTEFYTDVTQTLNTLLTERISKLELQTVKEDMDISIEMFGNTIMETFPKECIFITFREIQATMTLAISNAYHLMSTFPCMEKIFQKIRDEKILNTLIRSDRLQKNGTDQRKGKSGTESTEKIAGKTDNIELVNAKCAIKNIERCMAEKPCFVAINVELNGDEILTLMMSKEYVKDVVRNLQSINMLKQDFAHESVVVDGQKQKVYDLNVEDDHEYFAENILVHNCDAFRYSLVSHFPSGELSEAYTPEILERLYQEAMQEI
jgi:PBSX family phage terminase large subunit